MTWIDRSEALFSKEDGNPFAKITQVVPEGKDHIVVLKFYPPKVPKETEDMQQSQASHI